MHSAEAEREPSGQRPVILIGAGGHAGVLLNILRLHQRQVLFATDADPEARTKGLDGLDVQGGDDLIGQHSPDRVELVNGIGSAQVPRARRDVFIRFRERGYRFASVIHPSAVVEMSASLGEGVQIMAGAVIQHKVILGDNCLVNSCSSIDHDCVVGSHVHVAPGATVCGGVTIGEMTHVGAGSTIIQGVEVGRSALIGAGSLVRGLVGHGSIVMGVPARPPGTTRRKEGSPDA
jgi:sugar O-acyltransferase (sialic acid O-acetyltransferase NeuD family)